MRRKTKKDIRSILNTLQKAHEQALLLFRKNRAADAQKLLGDCQECAQQIGETIERIEGTGTQAVSVLEGYCELLYQMSQCKNRKEQAEWKIKMDDSICQVEREVKDVLPTAPLKVVFLPYKASMWDCLESVWEAAANDPDCEAIVVPIPYFERDEKGGAKKLCYEGEMFPSYVPVMPYEAFSLEAEQPDVIFIHNPYDDGNYVTSVHPNYYSAALKKYTDMLVYIPYFFNGKGPMPETHLNLPAYQMVDRIIVQDEEKAESLAQYVPKEKIVVLGSPKVDRLLKLEKKRDEIIETEIAPEWRDKIRGKKVVLYNVSVTGILHNSKVAMDKIRYVLSRFEGRKDVVLWWRPHPLMEATLQSMRVDLYEEYMRIKREFVRKGYGILDETGDAGIAAIVADAYLGENSSSLLHYFGVLGKPVYITCWSILEEIREEDRAGLFFMDCYFEGNDAWFVPRSGLGYQYLCKMDMDSGKISLEYELPGEFLNPAQGGSYFGISKIRENIILVPVWANDIYVYRLNTKQGIKIPLTSMDKQPNFSHAIEYDGKVFLTPRNYLAVIELDVETGHMIEYEVPSFIEVHNGEELAFGIGSAVYEDCIYIPCANRKEILIFHMRERIFSQKVIEDAEAGFYSLTSSGNKIWGIGNKTSEVICWNITSDEVKIYRDFPEGYIGGIQPFRQIVEIEDGMLVFPENANMTLFIGQGQHSASECNELEDFVAPEILQENPDNTLRYVLVKNWNSEVVALRAGNSGLVRYNSKKRHSEIIPCQLQKNDRRMLENKEFDRLFLKSATPGIIYENLQWSISLFLNYLTDRKGCQDEKIKMIRQKNMGIVDKDCGRKIHQLVKDEVWKK